MELALKAVRSRGMKKAAAAKLYGVPRTTLLDKLQRRSSVACRLGTNLLNNGYIQILN